MSGRNIVALVFGAIPGASSVVGEFTRVGGAKVFNLEDWDKVAASDASKKWSVFVWDGLSPYLTISVDESNSHSVEKPELTEALAKARALNLLRKNIRALQTIDNYWGTTVTNPPKVNRLTNMSFFDEMPSGITSRCKATLAALQLITLPSGTNLFADETLWGLLLESIKALLWARVGLQASWST